MRAPEFIHCAENHRIGPLVQSTPFGKEKAASAGGGGCPDLERSQYAVLRRSLHCFFALLCENHSDRTISHVVRLFLLEPYQAKTDVGVAE
nr:hypothetical protein [Brucella intermedia]